MLKRQLALVLWLLAPWSAAALAIPAEEARHLLVRTGFEAAPEQVAALARLDYPRAVERILKATREQALTSAPDWVGGTTPPKPLKQMSREEKQVYNKRLRQLGMELKGWWIQELHATDAPLTERMTLFWHNHFTSSLKKVRDPTLMYRQNMLLRRHALGNFRTLLHEIARDGAMLIYLDGRSSRKERPNENFARELLELFALGEGHYSEQDIKEAARAFTGWRVNGETGQVRFERDQHDAGEKRFLGRSGRFDGDAIIDILLEQPRTAEFMVEKLWREFISERPEPDEVRRLAAVFRQAGYELRPLMAALLQSPAFRAPENRARLVKSPVDLLLGTARLFALSMGEGRDLALAQTCRRLGQDLFDPPNVKGWPGGERWVEADALLTREQALSRLLRGLEMKRRKGAAMVETQAEPDLESLLPVLLPLPPSDLLPQGLSPREAALALVHDPAYQLK